MVDTIFGVTKKDQIQNTTNNQYTYSTSDQSVRTFTDARSFVDSRAYSTQYTYNPQIQISSPNGSISSKPLNTFGAATTQSPSVNPSVTSQPQNTVPSISKTDPSTSSAGSPSLLTIGLIVAAIAGVAIIVK